MTSRTIAWTSLLLVVGTAAGGLGARFQRLRDESAALRARRSPAAHSVEPQSGRSSEKPGAGGVAIGGDDGSRDGTAETDDTKLAERLLDRIEARLDLMTDVARWKWNAKQPIDDPQRESTLLVRIVEKARELGINPAFAAAFFRDQFESAKLVQRARFREWTAANSPPFVDVPDLAAEQRPRIDAATDALLESLAEIEPRRESWAFQEAFGEAARKRSANVPIRTDRWARSVLTLMPEGK